MPDPVTVLPVEQCDRDASAPIFRAYGAENYAAICEAGVSYCDGLLIPQTLAAHRIAAEQAGYERAEREIVAWLRAADDQAAEDLCTALWAETKCQRESNMFVGQPYFDLFADAIQSGAYRKQESEK